MDFPLELLFIFIPFVAGMIISFIVSNLKIQPIAFFGGMAVSIILLAVFLYNDQQNYEKDLTEKKSFLDNLTCNQLRTEMLKNYKTYNEEVKTYGMNKIILECLTIASP